MKKSDCKLPYDDKDTPQGIAFVAAFRNHLIALLGSDGTPPIGNISFGLRGKTVRFGRAEPLKFLK